MSNEQISRIPIEDDYTDVLKKAIRGHGLNLQGLADRSGLPVSALESLLAGSFQEESSNKICPELSLNSRCVAQLASGLHPPELLLPSIVKLENTAFPVPGYAEMTVNSYSIKVPDHPNTWILVDAGSSFESLFLDDRCREAPNLHLFLTHTHADHVAQMKQLSQHLRSVYSPRLEPYPQTIKIEDGESCHFGKCIVSALSTPGHSIGGMTYILETGGNRVAFVGDAVFCGSVGKVRGKLSAALDCIRSKILSLPDETILCPGHGPITTVGFEKANNPFFAES